MKKLTCHICLGIMLILLGFTTSAVFAVEMDVEDNDTFATSQLLPIGTTTVTGTLLEEFATNISDFSILDSLAAGGGDVDFFTVDAFDIAGLVSGQSFIAWIDNNIGLPVPDTVMGTFTDGTFSTLIDFDDDGSPIGDGLASGTSGIVRPDGTIRLGVTGYDDFGFSGLHSEEGDYKLFVRAGESMFNDVDFFTFQGLNPGDPFSVEVKLASFDSTLGWYDDFGVLIEDDDDGGVGTLSKLMGVVPASGNLNFVISSFADFDPFDGGYFGASGNDYELELVSGPIPEPATIALLGIGLAGLGGSYLRRRRKNDFSRKVAKNAKKY